MVPPPSTYRISPIGGCNMSSISCARNSYVDGSIAGFRKGVQLCAVALTLATLAACAQSSAVTNKSELLSAGRQASLEDKRNSSIVTTKRVAGITKNHTPLSADKHAAELKDSSYGLASFYSEGTRTASGETFDPHALTAAHPNLPFGTKLRVTDVATGRSVVVRVNDRGPFVPGRVVDVSYSAAASLGIIGRGTAKVKLDVVQ
jgi:rare lipoprotein A